MTFGPAVSRAATLTFGLDTEFSGGDEPAGTSPWVTATFDDSFGGANTVRLTMSTGNLVDDEIVEGWYFNFDPGLDPTALLFTEVDVTEALPNNIFTGVNSFQADGDGNFDILFDFPPPPGNTSDLLEANETVIYDITYTSAIDVNSFNFASVGGGGNGSFNTAAHVLRIGPSADGSGWIGQIPEPATGLLLGGGLLALAGFRRRPAA